MSRQRRANSISAGVAPGFWSAVGLVLSFLSVLVFCVGAQAILTMIRFLFDFSLVSRLDAHLYTAALALVGPLFALARVPDLGSLEAESATDDRLLRAVRPLFEWVLAPLLLAAALVLHLYAAKIGWTGSLPRNEVGWIVLTYTLLLLALRIALEPYAGSASGPVRFLFQLWAWSVVVPLALLALALQQRIATDGVTTERYYLALWWLSVAGSIALMGVPKVRSDIRVLVALPALLLVTSTIGPWGVADVVGRSQMHRIDAEFVTRRTATRDELDRIPSAEARSLYSRLAALEDVGELGRLRGRLADVPPDDPIWTEGETAGAIFARLIGTSPAPVAPVEAPPPAETAPALIDLRGYDHALFVTDASGAVRLSENGTHLGIRFADRNDRLSLSSVPAAGASTFDFVTEGGRHVRLHVRTVAATPATGEQPRTVTDLEALVLLREAEWRR